MRDKILIVTSKNEPNVGRIAGYLAEESREFIRLNTDEIPEQVLLTLEVGVNGLDWTINIGGKKLQGSEVKSVWYRHPISPELPQLELRYRKFAEGETDKFLWCLWTSAGRDEILWVNNPETHKLLEFNKPYQMKKAFELGLPIPETVISNDPSVIREAFQAWNGEMIVKTFGSRGAENEDGEPLSVYTNRVTEGMLQEFGNEIRISPVMVQRYVPKSIELRITIVGNKIFACAIHSQDSPKTRDDWRRYDFENVKHEVHDLPPDVEKKLLLLMNALELNFGAVDMILTPDNEYVFLEVNPSGQWGWIEALTEMPISEAIADLLANPPS